MFRVKIILTNGKIYEEIMSDSEYNEFVQTVIDTNKHIEISLRDDSKIYFPYEIIDRIEIKED